MYIYIYIYILMNNQIKLRRENRLDKDRDETVRYGLKK